MLLINHSTLHKQISKHSKFALMLFVFLCTVTVQWEYPFLDHKVRSAFFWFRSIYTKRKRAIVCSRRNNILSLISNYVSSRICRYVCTVRPLLSLTNKHLCFFEGEILFFLEITMKNLCIFLSIITIIEVQFTFNRYCCC